MPIYSTSYLTSDAPSPAANFTFCQGFSYSLGQMLGQLFLLDNELMTLVIGFQLSRAGEGKVASLITPMLTITYSVQIAMVTPVTFVVGKYAGALMCPEEVRQTDLNNEKLQRTVRNGAVAGAVYSPIIYIALMLTKPLLIHLSQPEEVAEDVQQFFNNYTGFFTFFMPRMLVEFVLIGFKRQPIAGAAATASLVVATAVGVLLQHQFCQPITSAALSAGVGVVITAMAFAGLMYYRLAKYKLHRAFNSVLNEKDRSQICCFITEASAMLGTSVLDVCTPFLLSIMAGWLGDHAQEKQNVAIQYMMVNAYIVAAANQTMSVLVSNRLGQGEYAALEWQLTQYVITTICATLAIQLPFALLVSWFPHDFSLLMGLEQGSENMRFLLVTTALYVLLDGARLNFLQALRALNANFIAAVCAAIFFVIGAGLSYYFSQKTGLELEGLPLGMTIGAACSDLCFYFLLKKVLKEKGYLQGHETGGSLTVLDSGSTLYSQPPTKDYSPPPSSGQPTRGSTLYSQSPTKDYSPPPSSDQPTRSPIQKSHSDTSLFVNRADIEKSVGMTPPGSPVGGKSYSSRIN